MELPDARSVRVPVGEKVDDRVPLRVTLGDRLGLLVLLPERVLVHDGLVDGEAPLLKVAVAVVVAE